MRKAPNPKVFMMLALGTFVAGAGANYMAFSSMSDAQGKIVSLKAQVKPTSEVQAELDKSNKDLADTTVQLKFLEAGVPDFAYVPTMLAQLETFGKANGLTVTGVRPTPPPAVNLKQGDDKPQRKAYDELNIEVKAYGKYADVLKFVSALQTFPKIVAMTSVSMSPKNDPTHVGTGGLDVTIALKAYVFSQATTPAAALPTPGTPAPAGSAPTSGTTPAPGATAAPGTATKPGSTPVPGTKPAPSAPPAASGKTASRLEVRHEG